MLLIPQGLTVVQNRYLPSVWTNLFAPRSKVTRRLWSLSLPVQSTEIVPVVKIKIFPNESRLNSI